MSIKKKRGRRRKFTRPKTLLALKKEKNLDRGRGEEESESENKLINPYTSNIMTIKNKRVRDLHSVEDSEVKDEVRKEEDKWGEREKKLRERERSEEKKM